MEIKEGNIVSVRDLSWSLVIKEDGSLKSYLGVGDADRNRTLGFKVIATNLKNLPSESHYFNKSLNCENDTIIQELKPSKQIIFIKKEFLVFVSWVDWSSHERNKKKEIKVGDSVKITNASGNYYVAHNGSLIHDYNLGATKNRRRFVVVATGLKNLPKSQCRGWYDRNDTILSETDKGNTYFTKRKYLELANT